jgi:1-acyl-sn-glycerol-3-phosphate acyltransferase
VDQDPSTPSTPSAPPIRPSVATGERGDDRLDPDAPSGLTGAPPTAPSRALVPVPAADPHPGESEEGGEHLTGRASDVDEWGRSEHMRSIARRIYDPVYSRWFRAEWEGLENIPTEGGALLVANHAAAIPSDAPVIMHGIEKELGRPVYGLADNFFKRVPVVGTLWSRLGGLPAHPDNAYRLLAEQGQLVLVFPGVPVVPIAVVGAEESMPTLFRLPSLASLIGAPYVPVTANMLALGPLGAVTYFPAKFKLRVLEPVTFNVPPDQERYSRSRVMDWSEAIRDRIQNALYDMLRSRESVWFG